MNADIAALLDEAEDIVNAAGIEVLDEQQRKAQRKMFRKNARSVDPFGPGSVYRLVGLPLPVVLRRGGASARAVPRGRRRRAAGRVAIVHVASVPRGPSAGEVHALHAELGASGRRRARGPFHTPWSGEHAPPSDSRPSLVAGKAVLHAFGRDAFDRFHLALMQAYFAANRTISERAVILDVACGIGLDTDELERRLVAGAATLEPRSWPTTKPHSRTGLPRYRACWSTTSTCCRARWRWSNIAKSSRGSPGNVRRMPTGLAARSRAMPVGRQAVVAVVVAVGSGRSATSWCAPGNSDAWVFTTWRLWFALPPLAVVIAVRRRRGRVTIWPPDVTRRRWTLLMFGAGAFFVASAGTTFAALGMTRLLDVSLIAALQPVLIIAFAVAFLSETVRSSHLLRAVVAVGATIVVAVSASSSGSWSLAGDVVAVISLVMDSAWFVYGRVLRTNFEIDPIVFMFGTLFTGALLMTPLSLIAHGSLTMSANGFFYAGCVMVAGTAAHVLMVWAHRYVPTSISSPLLLLQPPLVAAGAWVFFGESLTAVEIVFSAVVVASLWGVVRSAELEEVEGDLPRPGAADVTSRGQRDRGNRRPHE